MSQSRCQCGKTYRKGSMVFTIVKNGTKRGVSAKRVCPECAAEAIPILATPTIENREVKKEVRDDTVKRCIRMLTTYAKMARSSVICGDGTADRFQQGRAEGYEGAIECLKRESGEA